MMLDGKRIRDPITAELAEQIQGLSRASVRPGLAAVLVGTNPASQVYVRSKVKACESLGLLSEKIMLTEETSEEQLLAVVDSLNHREEIDAISVQLPLPAHIDPKRVLEAVDPAKDVDGFHPINRGTE